MAREILSKRNFFDFESPDSAISRFPMTLMKSMASLHQGPKLRPLKTQTLCQRQTFGFVNGIESDVFQNVTQTLSTLISLAIALILTPSLSLTHFCKSDNCGISKVTRDSDLICQILTRDSDLICQILTVTL
jgi:hypothetical protein